MRTRSKLTALVVAVLGAATTAALSGCESPPAEPDRPASTAPPEQAPLRVRVVGGSLEVVAQDVRLDALLRAIAERGSLLLHLDATLPERITVTFAPLPLDEALAHILRGRDYVFRSMPPGSGRPGELWVLADRPPASTDSSPGVLEAHDGRDGDDAGGARRAAALRALADGDEAATAAALLRALDDPDANVRVAAVESLGELGGATAAAAIAHALTSDDVHLRARAVDELAGVGGDTARALLDIALADDDPDVRAAAAGYAEALDAAAPTRRSIARN